MLWKLRTPQAKDVSFIYNSWLKSYRDSPAVLGLTNTTYFKEVHDIIERVFQSPTCRVAVACDPAHEDVIFGYAVAEVTGNQGVLHWVYVKHPFRNFGVGKALEAAVLTGATETVYTCHSKLSKSLLKTRPYVYNPFKFWSHK